MDDGADQNMGEVFLSLDIIYTLYIYILYVYILYIYILCMYIHIHNCDI